MLKNEQFGKTTTKLKVGDGRWKLSKFTKNWLEVIFVTKQRNKFLLIKNSSFNQKLIQNASNQLKPAWKRQIWLNSTKTESWSKQSKTVKNNWKLIESDSHCQQPTKNSNEKFTQNVLKCFKLSKTRSKTTNTAKQHKN